MRQSHHEAVSVAFAELERFAARRVRGGEAAWSEQVAVTGNLCVARFEHDASRALDAHLHTHLVAANATFDAKADKWFALTEREMLSAVRYAGKVYQNELAHRVLAAGYQIESARSDRGVIEGFEVVGVTAKPTPPEILVERVKPLRFAAQGNYDGFFKTFNDTMAVNPH